MAAAILVSTFGCNNGLILAGARAYYAMARDGLFFKSIATLNERKVPAAGLLIQGVWSALLVLPRTFDTGDRQVRKSVQQPARLRHLGGADLLHPDDCRRLPPAPDAARRSAGPYRAFGYPVVPVLYIAGALTILVVLFIYRPATTWPGLAIVLLGLPVYGWWSRQSVKA